MKTKEQKILSIIVASWWFTGNSTIASVFFSQLPHSGNMLLLFPNALSVAMVLSFLSFSLDKPAAFLKTVTGLGLPRCGWFGFKPSSEWLQPTPPSIKAECRSSWWLPEKCRNSKCCYSTTLFSTTFGGGGVLGFIAGRTTYPGLVFTLPFCSTWNRNFIVKALLVVDTHIYQTHS